ncbi:GIY-YIG nuclease family protein [Aggregatimonas sangjinii]|uniref:GIY-YIG nuclease family protein n=1 Tax=Aggregatimonas sangjinii TaxID=2583587 RepID=A0A5B7SWY9_9FLAO|nr:GIY-YIG nuclease family protein [Aggregatimonas sangjinii]QCX01703.1 GIY-YIG nuclease family protein [Aggregatimonas sangjinii]
MHYIYILYSIELNRFYTGQTSNVEIRKDFHDQAPPNKFTAQAKDWELFHEIACQTKEQALKIEMHIKRMKSSTYIKNLKKYPEITEKLLERYKR